FVMDTSPIKQEETDSARWIVGKHGASHGVYTTESGRVVKYGHHVQAEREARAMSFVRKACPQVPVPEVLGWWEEREGEDRVGHLAMSLMPGDMLSKSWPTMDQVQRDSILKDLEEILRQLRTLRAPSTAAIGPVDGTSPAADVRGSHAEYGGPFKTESDFNEWLVSLIHLDSTRFFGSFYVETIRNSLMSNHQLRFTHGDLAMHNILVEKGRITAIIDWEYSGWYPEYWEYVKMIQFSRDTVFRCFGRGCWRDEEGKRVVYDLEFVVDQMLDGQARNGQRVIKRPRVSGALVLCRRLDYHVKVRGSRCSNISDAFFPK
ncbi:hypothetical protein LOZ48_003953, partial [Ophidiomyces ophidiicola]